MKILFSLILAVTFMNTFCQQKGANISFDAESFNFGKIEEAKGAVSHVYNFTNTGSEPLVLQNVQPSCGCTTPEWSKQPVVPGGKGFIKATFNPAGRPGPFAKSITVVSNAASSPVILKFTGEVIGKTPAVEDKFSFAIDNLRLVSTYLAFGKISPAKTASKTIEVLNGGSTPISLAFPGVAPHLEILVSPSTIKPGQKASITINYNAKTKNDWGFVSDEVFFTMNGKKDAKYKFNLSANIEDDYSQATPQQIANAPRMTLDKTVADVGRLKAGAQVELVYRFKNMGKTNLEIHKIQPSCGCTNVKVSGKSIKPGGSGEIRGVFSSAGQKGSVNKTISVITNDPKNLNLILWIKGNVE
jgi:uncharacterized cupredoxin-like copper-binding protein